MESAGILVLVTAGAHVRDLRSELSERMAPQRVLLNGAPKHSAHFTALCRR